MGKKYAKKSDTIRRSLHKGHKSEFVLVDPPFSDSYLHNSDADVRWKYGCRPLLSTGFVVVS